MSATHPQSNFEILPRPRGGQRRRIGPFSRAGALATIDGRTTEARYLRNLRKELTAQLGGSPTPSQRMLLERAAVLSLHLAMMDERLLAAGTVGEAQSKQYLAWSASLTRTLAALGFKCPDTPEPDAQAELLAHLARSRAA